MSQKRQPTADEGSTSPDEKRRKFNLRSVVEEVIKMRSVQHLLEPILEPLIRRVVREEIELALKKHLANMKRNSSKEIDSTKSRSLKLQFVNGLSLPVFTGARIEAEDCPTIKVVLIDSRSGDFVNSGPESSAKVEIVVLEGDFDSEEAENWTTEEFKSNIVREREGKKSLLTGDVILNLKDGICMVGEISFTDNSSWTRSRKFRLGARVLESFESVRIQEAKTESFIVRDHRGELYKKHHPPSLFDEVWRLEKIGKDGAFHKRLTRENILTVKDFLTLLFLDPPRLRQILGTGMSAKMWEVTVEHARTCVLDKRVHLYYPPASQQKIGVVFNIVGQVMGLLKEFQYVQVDKLSEAEKVDAQSWVLAAFERWIEVISFEDESALLGGSSQLSNGTYNPSLPGSENSDANKLSVSQRMGGFDFVQPSSSSPDIISSIYSAVSGSDDYTLHNIENMILRYDPTLTFPGQIIDTDLLTQAFSDGDNLQFFDTELQSQSPHFEPQADLQSALEGFLMAHSTSVVARSPAVAIDKAQRRWRKISSVLKWFRIRKLVASKRTCFQEIHRYK